LFFFANGDVNTKFFHLKAFHHNRQNCIKSFRVDGLSLVQEEEKADEALSLQRAAWYPHV
jgi:hypothetical protein